jgi:riboflavin synthase
MFTGIIEEIGKIINITSFGGGKKVQIQCKEILTDSKVNDSISINGICQTITGKNEISFEFVSVEETIKKTTIKNWKVNQKVNLERAIKLSDRLGGHLLLGHVDDTGKIIGKTLLKSSTIFEIEIQGKYSKFIIPQGSIAIDGISLTIADINHNAISVSIIPHTIDNTILKYSQAGDDVNLEFDVIGKYVEKILSVMQDKEGLTIEKLKNLGY